MTRNFNINIKNNLNYKNKLQIIVVVEFSFEVIRVKSFENERLTKLNKIACNVNKNLRNIFLF